MNVWKLLILMWAGQLNIFSFAFGQDSTGKFRPGRAAEILRSGFLDITTNGQVGASARLVRIWIGDPDRLSIPLSIYAGVSSGSLSVQPTSQGGRNNEQLLNSFINPLSGLVNFFFDRSFPENVGTHITSGAITCQFGGRLLSGSRIGSLNDPQAGRPVNFFNSYGSVGLYFQTGAWEGERVENLGVFWIAMRYISSYSAPGALEALLSGRPSGFYHGWSIGTGVEITDLVNIKVIYYKYVKEPELPLVTPLCQFSFHYSLRN